jgi:hypothetical protein
VLHNDAKVSEIARSKGKGISGNENGLEV